MNAKQVKALFWESFPDLDRKRINDGTGRRRIYKCDTRVAFVDFIDSLHRDGQITDRTAQTITLD